MAATTPIIQRFKFEQLTMSRELVVDTAVKEGWLVSIDGSGDAVPAVTTARIAGVAQNDAAAGERVTCYFGRAVWLNKSNAAATDVGVTMYAADNDTVTATPNTAILGPVVDWETGHVLVSLTLRA